MNRSILMTAAGLLALSTFSPQSSRAADHRDWPGYQTDITADITDVYAWMSPDAAKVYLVLDIQGANLGATATTKFSDVVQYNIRLNSQTAYGQAGSHADNILCKFDNSTPQNFECWGPGTAGSVTEYVKDVVGNTQGKTSKSGKMKVFVGPRDDPFYFNIRGFLDTAATVKAAAGVTGLGALTFDAAGCPNNISVTGSMNLVNKLKQDGAGGTPADDFGKNGLSPLPPGSGGMTNGNVLSIVVAIDKTLLTAGGNVVSVWASTNR